MSVKEGLEGIAEEVLGDVQKEAQAIIEKVQSQAKETLQAAKQQAEQNYQAIVNQAKTRAEAEKRKIASLTDVDIRNQMLQTKEKLVDAAFEKATQKLKDHTKTDQYNKQLLRMIEQAASKLREKNLNLIVNAQDREWLLKGSLEKLGQTLKVNFVLSEQTIEVIGGCKIQTTDSKIQYDSTIDNRLEQLKPTLRAQVAKILFGSES